MRLLHAAAATWLAVIPMGGAAGRAAHAGAVEVHVTNVADARGTVRAEICSPGEWLKDGCAHKSLAPASPGVTTLTLRDVGPGTWAVVVFHDRNNDGEVDRNLLGIPTEGIGFSRNPALGLHGPSFEAAAFTIDARGGVIEVRLRFE